MPRQRRRAVIPRGALLTSLLMVIACSKAPPTLPAASQAPPSSSAPGPASAAAASSDDAAWDGFLAERLAPGMTYINDANARDSTSAFEAILVTEATPPGSGPTRPEGIEGYWKPTITRALEVGNEILAAIAPTSGASAPSYRYLLIAVIEGGKQKILAKPLCDEPDWWKAQVGQSKLCRSAGSCGHPIPASLRGDCQLRFSYDVATGALNRSSAR